jgi:hypothetical protein
LQRTLPSPVAILAGLVIADCQPKELILKGMNWFRIEINKGKEGSYHFVGSSEDDAETLVKKAQNGFFIQLDNLLYLDRGEVKEWAEWDASAIPTAYINPKDIISVMEFKGDPRELRHR